MVKSGELDAKFRDSLFGEDELGVVVRAHIHIEARLNELLHLLTPVPDRLPRLQFEQRVNLIGAMGIDPNALTPFKKLGHIRNKFGHQLRVSLTVAMVDDFWDSISSTHQKVIVDGYEATREQFPDKKMPEFNELSPKDRFISIVVCLDKLIDSAMEECSS